MSAQSTDFEALLSEALSPVDPPDDLLVRVESTLVSLAVPPRTSSRPGSCRRCATPATGCARRPR